MSTKQLLLHLRELGPKRQTKLQVGRREEMAQLRRGRVGDCRRVAENSGAVKEVFEKIKKRVDKTWARVT